MVEKEDAGMLGSHLKRVESGCDDAFDTAEMRIQTKMGCLEEKQLVQ